MHDPKETSELYKKVAEEIMGDVTDSSKMVVDTEHTNATPNNRGASPVLGMPYGAGTSGPNMNIESHKSMNRADRRALDKKMRSYLKQRMKQI